MEETGNGNGNVKFTHWVEDLSTGKIIGRLNLEHMVGQPWEGQVALVPAKFRDRADAQSNSELSRPLSTTQS
jgi:hypothetical protein